ncbi:MAG TPA: PAS domain S-box protein [Holophagaceae bacterium]|nr:PAS domain S-box protein [Holophagaceae bacterium]
MSDLKDQPVPRQKAGEPNSGHAMAMRAMEAAGQFRTLAEGILSLSLAQTEEGLHAVLLERAAAILPGPHWSLGRLTPGEAGLEVEIVAVSDSVAKHFGADLKGLRMPVHGNQFSIKVYRDRQVCFVQDAPATPGMLDASLTARFGWRSVLGVPILQDSVAVGGLYGVSFADEPLLDPSEAQLAGIQNLARVAGLALERVRLWTQLQQELRQRKESEALYRALVEEALSGVYLIQDGAFQYCNPAFCEIFGYTEEELRGKPVGDLVSDQDRQEVLDNVRKRVGGEMKAIHYTFLAQGKGRVIPVEVHGSAVQWGGRPAVLGVLLDITERLSTQEALKRSKELAEMLAQATRELALARDAEELFTALFAAARRISGLPLWWHNRCDLATGVSVTDHWVVELEALFPRDVIVEPMQMADFTLLQTLHLAKEPVWIPHCQGHPAFPPEYLELIPHQSAVLLPLLHQGESVGGLIGGTISPDGERELSEDQLSTLKGLSAAAGVAISRLRDHEALEASEARYRQLFDQSADAILLGDEAGFMQGNEAAARLFGIPRTAIASAKVGAFSPEFQPTGERSRDLALRYMRKALDGHIIVFPWVNQRADGTLVHTEIKMGLVHYEGRQVIQSVLRDVTEARKVQAEKEDLQRQLFQAQKMESLGILAGGIAHDFNNLLTGMLGHADLALTHLDANDPLHRHLEAVRKTALRASELTRQLLAYSGRGAFVLRKLDLTGMVEEMAELLEVSVPRAVSLKLDLGRGLPAIEVDAAQIQQVVMNLVINAAEAMGGTEGTIRLSTGMERLDAEAIRGLQGGEARPGEFVFLRVADTGCGMDEETLARIFEPFFSTKFTGRGLGLSALLGIVRGHGGGLRVRSSLGDGTVFTVYFPAAQGPIAEPAPAPGPAVSEKAGSGLVLVVDDDDMVRAVARQSLEMYGYEVIEAADGAQALDCVRDQGRHIRLVVLDATMPNLSGESTLRELHALLPELPVLLSSGYAEGETLERFPDLGTAHFLPKPYGPKDLLAKVRALI